MNIQDNNKVHDIEDPYNLIYEHLRNLNIMTDAFYILAGIYSYIVYLKTDNIYLLFSFILYLTAGVVSILHHQATRNNLFRYDIFTAGVAIFFSVYITTISLLNKKIYLLLYTLTFILLGCSFINYYYSQKYNRYIASHPPDSLEFKYYSIMKYLHHTLWHILSGICACTVPLALYVSAMQ